MMCDLQSAIRAAESSTLAGIKSGEAIGFRAGMLRAAEICEERGRLHAEGMRSLAMSLADDIRRAVKEVTK